MPAFPRPSVLIPDMLGAFQHRNYRLWFVGQLVSLVGSWMQTTAQGYLVYELTGNPFYLGMVGFAAGAPSWLLMLYGGVISDRISRRSLLIFTQAYLMLLAFILAGLVFTGLVQPWHIVALSALVGVGNAFDAPGRQAFVAELVSRKDLSNAIAFNASMFNLAVIVGPAVGAVTYSLVGPAWCFTINGLTFLAVIGALALMHLPSVTRVRPRTSAGAEIAEGLRFVASHKLILLLIFNLGMLSVFGMSLMTLMPGLGSQRAGGRCADQRDAAVSARRRGADRSADDRLPGQPGGARAALDHGKYPHAGDDAAFRGHALAAIIAAFYDRPGLDVYGTG
jgi:MFS family permease